MPAFDLVRVEPDGSAVVAGTAEPGAEVTIFADQAPLAEAEADAEGNFVAIFNVAPSEAPRALTLGATPPERRRGDVGRRGDAAAEGAAAATDAAAGGAGGAAAACDGRDRPPAGAADRGRPSRDPRKATPAAPQVRRRRAEPAARRGGGDGDRAGGRRRGRRRVGSGDGDVSLASISYAEAGRRDARRASGTAGAVLRAYVDDELRAEEARVGADGRWSDGPRRRRRPGSTSSASTSWPPTARWRAGSRRRSSATSRGRRCRGPAGRRPRRADDHRAAGQQPLDFGAGALWFGRAVHPDLHRQPRADPRSGPDLSGPDLRDAGSGRPPTERMADAAVRRAPAPAAGGRSAGSRPYLWPTDEPDAAAARGVGDGRADRRQARDGGDAVLLQGGGRRPGADGSGGAGRLPGRGGAGGADALLRGDAARRRRLHPAPRRGLRPGRAAGAAAARARDLRAHPRAQSCAITSPGGPAA